MASCRIVWILRGHQFTTTVRSVYPGKQRRASQKSKERSTARHAGFSLLTDRTSYRRSTVAIPVVSLFIRIRLNVERRNGLHCQNALPYRLYLLPVRVWYYHFAHRIAGAHTCTRSSRVFHVSFFNFPSNRGCLSVGLLGQRLFLPVYASECKYIVALTCVCTCVFTSVRWHTAISCMQIYFVSQHD